MEYDVLGRLEVVAQGRRLQLGGPKQRAVLALLIAADGRQVSTGGLIEGVYGDGASDRAHRSIHTFVSNLRRELGDVIEPDGDGYIFTADRATVDANRFEDLVSQAAEVSDPEQASELLQEALALWRGHPYADFDGSPALAAEVTRLNELRIAAIEGRIDADLALGRHRELIGELESLTAEYPLRERFRAQHMLALYRAGRQAESLRAFERTRTYLAEELGLDPSPELRELEQRILEQDPELAPAGRAAVRRASVLVVDVDDPRALAAMTPADREATVAAHSEVVDAAVAEHGGEVITQRGSAVYAAFDHARSAAAAADLVVRERSDGPQQLRLRAAIAVGDVESADGGVTGPPITRAAALVGAAHGGQVLLTAEAQSALTKEGERWLIRGLGTHDIAGLDGEQVVFQLVVEGVLAESALRTETLPPSLPWFSALSGYELRKEIGRGTFGVVHRGYQRSVGREVAIKIIRPELANDAEFIRRFEIEAQLVARLEHPHIVPMYDYWRSPDGAFLVMPWLGGKTLQGRLAAGPMTVTEASRVLDQVGPALAYAHRHGVVHRDIKPSNVLLDEDGNAYLSDFGVAVSGGDTTDDLVALGELLGAFLVDLEGPVAGVIERARSGSFADVPSLMEAWDLACGGIGSGIAAVRFTPTRNPYKGLQAFGELDAADFHGRDDEIAHLVEVAAGQRLVVVVGPSGTGKSSVVRAGLIPAVRNGAIPGSDRWLITELIPGHYPLEELTTALLRVAASRPAGLESELRKDARGLLTAVRRYLPEGAELLLLVDQFEELFTLAGDEDRQVFLELLRVAVTDERSPVRVVLTMRADYFDHPLRYGAFGELLRESTVPLSAPTADELRDIVELPAQGVGVRFEPGLVERIVSTVEDQPGALPLLEFSLTELFASRESDLLTIEAYETAGGVLGALGRRAEATYLDLDPSGRAAARHLLLLLVNVSESGRDTRRRVRRSELRHVGVDEGPALEAFAEPRLLTFDRDPVTRAPTVEVAHEALLTEWPRLAGWIDGQREDLVLRARLAAGVADWEAAGRAESHLLTGGILSQHETWTADTELLLTATERQFLDASRKSENARLEERRRTRRAVMVGFGAAAVIALVLAVAATVAWNRARERAAAAKAGQLVAASTVELDRDPELGLLLAIEANEIAPPTADSDAALRRALFQHRGILTHELPRGGVPGGDLSPDGTLLAVAGHSSGLVEAIAVDTGSERWRYDLGERVSVYQPFFVDGGRQLVVPAFWTGPGTPPDMVAGLHVLDASSGEVVRFLDVGECGVFDAGTRASGDEYVYATVPDCGRTVSVITDVIGGTDTPDDLPIVRIDLADGAATTISDTWAFRMDASADETRIAMTTRDSEGELLSVTDTMTGEVLFELRDDFSEQIATLAPDGRLLVYEEFPSGDLIVVDLASGRQVTRYFGHRFDVTNVWFADDGDAVYSAGRDGTLQVWDPTTGATLERIPFGDAAISAAVSDDLTRVVVFSGTSTVKVYDFDHGGRIVGRSYDPVAPLDDCDFRFNQSFSLQVVGNTATMLAVCFADWDDGYQPFRLVTFDVTTGEPLRDHTPALGINSRLSPDGSTVAGLTAGSDGFSEALEIIDVTQGEAIVAMAGLCGVDFLRNPAPGCADYPETPFADGGALQFGPAGAELAMAGSVTNAVVVWDTRSGDIVTTRRADGELLGVAYSPDGSQLLVGTSDGLTAYSTDDWSVVGKRSWRGESGTAPGQLLAFTSDGARLVAASSDRLGGGSDVFVLDPASLETIARIEQPQNGALRMLDVSRDDRRLATAGTDGFARVWDIETLELVAELPISEDAVTNIQFADNDRKLLVTTQESDLIVVDLESEAALDLARGRLTRSFTRTECRIHGIDPCPTLEELRAGVPTAEAPTSARAGTPAPAPETTTTSVATTSTVEAPRLAEPDVCSAPGTCPDFGTALAGDDGVGPLPLGSVGDVPNQHRLDFLFRVCDRRRCSLDAHFMDPENAERGASPWSAGEPFHVRHGFANPGAEPLGEGFSVAMYVSRQGADRDDPPEVTEAAAAGFEPGEVYEFTPDYVLRGTSDRCGPTFETQSDPVTCEWFVHDFPDGLPAGRFTLWAVWEAPCAAWIDLGLADSCTDPAEVISRFSSSVNSPFGDFPQEYDHERD